MLSFNKLLVLVAVLGVVIVAYRVIGMMKRQRDEIERLRRQDVTERPSKATRGQARAKEQSSAQDMRRCPTCNAFVVAGSSCARANCPMG